MTTPDSAWRTETDAIGEFRVPADALFGIHTARAAALYPPTLPKLADDAQFRRSYGAVKKACALTNAEFGTVPSEIADAISKAAEEVMRGDWAEQFPSPLLQGAGGVTTNMNVNEVLANRATMILGGRPGDGVVHPNDHVNRSQSTNDTYPTAAALTTLELLDDIVLALKELATTLEVQAVKGEGIQRLGRTCLRDALPVTVADTHGAHAALITRAVERLKSAAEDLHHVPLGATAVGTGAGSPLGFGEAAVKTLSALTGRRLQVSNNYFDALSHLDSMVDVAHAVGQATAAMSRIASDLRLLSSGPQGGFDEVTLPPVTAGSSIMPGKTNPSVPEFVMQADMEVQGRVRTVEAAAAAGELELNVMEPVMFSALWSGMTMAAQASRLFSKSCIAGLAWNTEALERGLGGSFLGRVQRAVDEGYSRAASH